MTETKVAPQSDTNTEVKTPGNVVSRGPVSPVTFTPPVEKTDENNNGAGVDTGTDATSAAAGTETDTEKNKLPELSDEQFKELLKGKGIELDDKGLEGLKEKLKPAVAAKAPEEIEKEKAAAESAFEKRMVDHFLEHGGTVEQFANLKTIAGADLKELSASEIRREMKDAKFTDEEITTVLKERYYQINPEELVIGEDEKPEDFEKRKALTEKKIAFGAKKLESKSSHIKKQAEDALGTLREVIKQQDLQKAEELQNSKRVEEFFAKAPRKVTFELGKAKDGKEIAPIEYPIPETIITDVMGTLKDPAKLKQFLYNTDNSLNLDNLSKVMLENNYLKEAIKEVFSQGGTRQVEAFEKIFPGRIAKEIGVGGATGGNANARKGVLVSRGEPEPVRR